MRFTRRPTLSQTAIAARFSSSLIIFLVLSLSAPASGWAESELEKRFKKIYRQKLGDRLFYAREVPGNLKRALKSYRQAFNSRGKETASWKITRCYWALAKAASDKKKKLKYLQKGTKHGKITEKNNPGNSDAYLWRFMIMESWTRERGMMNMIHIRDKIKKGFEKVLKLNPKSLEAYLGLGRWRFNAPASLGGDKDKAFRLIEQALKIDPDYTPALLLKAKFLIREQKRRPALKTLKRLSQITRSSPEINLIQDKAEAGELIKQLEKISVRPL